MGISSKNVPAGQVKQAPVLVRPSPSIQDRTFSCMETLYYSVEFIVLILSLSDKNCLTDGIDKSKASTVIETGIFIPGCELIRMLDTLYTPNIE